jgi:hypothetical protein
MAAALLDYIMPDYRMTVLRAVLSRNWPRARIPPLGKTMARKLKPDLVAFVAEVAVEAGDPIPISCNCGGIITIMPPLQEELVVCAKCESRIKLLVLSGDPGYVVGQAPDGEPMLIPVQGSSKEMLEISPQERREILERIRREWIEKKS